MGIRLCLALLVSLAALAPAVTTEDSVPPNQLKNLAAVLAVQLARRFKGDYSPIKAVPTNYVIDRAGLLRYAKAGAWTLEDLNDILVPLLREDAPVS